MSARRWSYENKQFIVTLWLLPCFFECMPMFTIFLLVNGLLAYCGLKATVMSKFGPQINDVWNLIETKTRVIDELAAKYISKSKAKAE